MTGDTIERRLVAIASVDVAGYSRMIAADEVGTVRTLTEYRGAISELTGQHGGRVVDNPGDNALLEFPSATSAVECAIAIQEMVAFRSRDVPVDRRMQFRIGVHLGEVIVDDGRIYGDGVNVAARLESMAPVAGIVVSRAVRDQVAAQLRDDLEDLGRHQLKNIAEPIQVFRVGPAAVAALVSVSVPDIAARLAADPDGTRATLTGHRTATDPIVTSHAGKVVELDDRRALFAFASPAEAVRCASEVQALMAARNSTSPEQRRMHYRIGVVSGDEPDARRRADQIQEQTEPGGIGLSDDIYREVADDLPLSFADGGTLDDGAMVWNTVLPTDQSADATSGPGVLLVLPFERLGSDPGQDYLVDGITEDVITAISHYGELRVVPRGTAFAYRDSPLRDRDVARRVDATYILRGTVRATESRVRVSAELTDAESGRNVWSERFDRDYEDVLDVQDELALSIVTRLGPTVRAEEVARGMKPSESLESWHLIQRAKWHYYRATREDFDRAIELYEQAIAEDPSATQAYSWLCLATITRIWHGWSRDIADDFERVRSLATQAIRLDPGDWRAHNALSVYYMFQTKDFDRAIAEAEHGERFEPGALGAAYNRAGEHERAIELLMRDLQFNPNRPDRYHWTMVLAQSHYMLGNDEAALAWTDRTLELNPRYIQAVGFRAAALSQLGRATEAAAAMDVFLGQFEGMTASRYKTRFNYRYEADVDRYIEGLVKAGMPAGDAEPTPDRRAAWIAVLPFENLSGDPDQEYFADGIAEEIITGLSAYRSLRVIARTSSFRYRGSDLPLPQIADELGVRYLLEGSVRRHGDRVRVTAQLIEAPDRHHIWADRFDEDLDDVFEAQDRITASIVAAIDPAIRTDHVARARPGDLDAWDHVQRGWYEQSKARPEPCREAIRQFQAALDDDPAYAQAHAGLASSLFLGVWLLWSEDPGGDLQRAEHHAKRAIDLDERDAVGHEALAMVAYAQGRMATTVKEGDHAVRLNPSRATAHMMAGVGRIHGGDPGAGIPIMTRAIELSPQDAFVTWFYGGRAIGHLLAGHHPEAIEDARRAIADRYGYLFGRVIVTVALVKLERVEEAEAQLSTILDIDPEFGPEYMDRYTFTDEQRDMIISSLATAGLAR